MSDAVSITIYSGITMHSLEEAGEAVKRYNSGVDRDERITHPDALRAILNEACDADNLREYIADTGDGLEDCNIDDEAYLDHVIEKCAGEWGGAE
jgi:hypothetical protein